MDLIVNAGAGLIAAVLILGVGSATRQEQSPAFYGNVLVGIALVYVLFAVMGGAPRAIAVESAIAAAFVALAVAAVRQEAGPVAGGLLAAGLVAHGGYDLVHASVVSNPVVPGWWPTFCGAADLALGGWVYARTGRSIFEGTN